MPTVLPSGTNGQGDRVRARAFWVPAAPTSRAVRPTLLVKFMVLQGRSLGLAGRWFTWQTGSLDVSSDAGRESSTTHCCIDVWQQL